MTKEVFINAAITAVFVVGLMIAKEKLIDKK